MNRVPENFRPREITAKQVQSLGGNRGMEHTPVPVPSEVQRDLERAVAELHRQLDLRVQVSDEIDEAVQESVVAEEIEEEVDEAVQESGVAQEVEKAIDEGVQESRVAQEIEEEIGAAIGQHRDPEGEN